MTRVWNLLASAGHPQAQSGRPQTLQFVPPPSCAVLTFVNNPTAAEVGCRSGFQRVSRVVCARGVVRGTPDDTADSNEFRSQCVPSLSTVMAKHTCCCPCLSPCCCPCCCPCLSNSKDVCDPVLRGLTANMGCSACAVWTKFVLQDA